MTKLLAGLLLGAAVVAASSAHAATIQDGFVQAGVNAVTGTLGTNAGTPPGILYDATGTGNYGNNDFLTPGDPYEGFYITADGGYHQSSNNDLSGNNSFGTAVLSGVTATGATATATAIDGSLSIVNVYSLTTIGGRSVISITTTLKNLSGSSLTGLDFLRTLDPDPDVNNYGSYVTQNSIINPQEACATGSSSGQTICISTNNTAFTSGAGVGAPGGVYGTWDTTPSDFLANTFASASADDSIGLAFALGTLNAGASDTFSYFYALGADKGTASGGTSVPEPLTMSIFGAGLAGAAAMRRRRKNKNKSA